MTRLDAEEWIVAGGLSTGWQGVGRLRLRETLARLRGVARAFPARAPEEVRSRRYLAGLAYFLRDASPERDRLALDPSLDYWLFLWDKHFGLPCGVSDWHLQMGLFSGLAAWLALRRGATLELDSVIDPDGRWSLHGSPYALAFPLEWAQRPLRLSARGGVLRVAGPAALTLRLSPRSGLALSGGGAARLERSRELADGIVVESRSWLVNHGVTVHRRSAPEGEALDRFVAVLGEALADMRRGDPALVAEMTDMIRLLVPLETPADQSSVSSSYVHLRGAVCLSHSDDPVLQAETLIHEFCHQKMNQLTAADPLLEPGQGGQVFYSPWRKDPRRLRGLLLGAHAFLNVARYLLASLSRRSYRREAAVDAMYNVAWRLGQVESALRTVSTYAALTEFGRRFVLGMWRQAGLARHGTLWFPPALVQEARDACGRHASEHALWDTGFHKSQGFVDKAKRAPFLTPGDLTPPPAAPAAPAQP